jgi:hypothetical protein
MSLLQREASMYDTVYSQGAWRVRDYNGRISAIGFESEGRAGQMAAELNAARGLAFNEWQDDIIVLARRMR